MIYYLHQVFDPVKTLLTSQGLEFAEVASILAGLTLCLTLPWIRIFKRVGHSPLLGVLMFVPLVNIFIFLLFAYHEWPIEHRQTSSDSLARWM